MERIQMEVIPRRRSTARCRGRTRSPENSCVVDPVGAALAREKKIELSILDGKDLVALESAIIGNKFRGTRVTNN